MRLYTDFIQLLDKYSVIIECNHCNVTLVGTLSSNNNLAFGNSAQWGELLAQSAREDIETGFFAKAISYASKALSEAYKQNKRTLLSSYKGYDSSSVNPFPINMIVIPGIHGVTEYSDFIEKASKFTLPKEEENTGQIYSHLYNPTDTWEAFTSNDRKKRDIFKNQLIHVHIGDMFTATGLTCNDFAFNMSNKLDDNGKPLFMEVQFTFEPYRVLTAEEFAKWFRV